MAIIVFVEEVVVLVFGGVEVVVVSVSYKSLLHQRRIVANDDVDATDTVIT